MGRFVDLLKTEVRLHNGEPLTLEWQSYYNVAEMAQMFWVRVSFFDGAVKERKWEIRHLDLRPGQDFKSILEDTASELIREYIKEPYDLADPEPSCDHPAQS